jgi:hypothetical protein
MKPMRQFAQPCFRVAPLRVDVAPDRDRGYGSGADVEQRSGGALGAGAGRPRVIDEEDARVVEAPREYAPLAVERALRDGLRAIATTRRQIAKDATHGRLLLWARFTGDQDLIGGCDQR